MAHEYSIKEKTPISLRKIVNIILPFPINQPARCNNFPSLLLDVYVRLNMFRSLSGRFNRPDNDQKHCYHHAPTVKPEAAPAAVELLMMGVRTPETCSAVHKRQAINLRNFCI
jgi:hypothetical protein